MYERETFLVAGLSSSCAAHGTDLGWLLLQAAAAAAMPQKCASRCLPARHKAESLSGQVHCYAIMCSLAAEWETKRFVSMGVNCSAVELLT